MLVAARTDAATELLLPEAARVGQLSTNQATQLANDVTRTEAGELVPVPGSEAVAMMPTKVKGASSAALLVSADGLKRAAGRAGRPPARPAAALAGLTAVGVVARPGSGGIVGLW